jgi:hypothetical protein
MKEVNPLVNKKLPGTVGSGRSPRDPFDFCADADHPKYLELQIFHK